MILDIVIGLVVVVALYVGYQRGVIQPLLVEVGFFGTLLVIILDRQAFATFVTGLLHTSNVPAMAFITLVLAVTGGAVGGFIGHKIHKMPVVRGVDGFLGVVLHLLLAIVALYLIVSALVVLDKTFTPAVQAANLKAAEVLRIESALRSNPITAGMIDPRDLAALEAAVGSKNGAHIENVPAVQNLVLFYQDWLRPQLRASKLSKYVVIVGSRIPLVGHVTTADLAAVQATPVPTPSPSPTPTK